MKPKTSQIALYAMIFLLFALSVHAEDFISGYGPPPPTPSKCSKFLTDLTNRSIAPIDRSLEANNTLLFSGHNLNDLGAYKTCTTLSTQKYHIIGIGGGALGMGFCGPSFCTTSELQKIADNYAARIKNMTHRDVPKPSIIDPTITKIEEGFFFYFATVVMTLLIMVVIAGTLSVKWRKDKEKAEKAKYQASVIQVNQEDILSIRHNNPSAVSDSNQGSLLEALLANRETVNEVVSNDTVNVYLKKKEASPPAIPLTKPKKEELSLFTRIIECFDANDSLKSFLSYKMDPNHDGNLNIFNGIRTLCFGWVLYGHLFASHAMARNYAFVALYYKSWWLLILQTAVYAVDTFFFLSGFFTGFILISKMKSLPFSVKNYFMIFLHRLLRLWPAYLFTFLFFWKISVHYGGDMLWFNFVKTAQSCSNGGWVRLLFIENIVTFPDYTTGQCFLWGWYLTNDMQMFLIAPFLCWIFVKNRDRGYNLTWLLFFFSIVSSYYESINTGDKNADGVDGMADSYGNPLVRMAPYLMGLALGFMFREYKSGRPNFFRTLKNSQVKSLICFLIGLGGILFITFYPRQKQTGEKWNTAFSTTWTIFARSGFTLGVFLLCAPGLSGSLKPVTRIMGNYYFTLISRVSYTGYLIHFVLIYLVNYDNDQFFGLNQMYTTMVVFGLFMASCLGGLIIQILVEKPFTNLEAKIISKKPQRALPNNAKAKKI